MKVHESLSGSRGSGERAGGALVRRLVARVLSAKRPTRAPELFEGEYEGWEAACAASDGYDDDVILARVRESSRAARDQPAAFERDGVLFAEPQWNFPFLACLLRCAAACRGRLHVLDVGGSLGSSYRHARPFLSELADLRWSIVEQAHFVLCGRREFETHQLRFFDSLREAAALAPIDLVLLSSVLPYLPEPYELLEQLAQLGVAWVLVDRTPISKRADDRIAVQRVPATIYGRPVSYPARIFARERLLGAIARHWSPRFETAALDGAVGEGEDRIDFRLVLAGPMQHEGAA